MEPLANLAQSATLLRSPSAEPWTRPFELLSKSQLFQGLPDPMLVDVAKLMRPLMFATGDAIFRQGTAPDGLYLLETGEVLLWARAMDSRMELVRFQAGQVLCQSALVESAGRLATAECLQPSKVWVLDTSSFEGLCSQRHPTAFALLEAGSRHLSAALRDAIAHFRDALELSRGPAEVVTLQPSPPRAWRPEDLALLKVLPIFKPWPEETLAALVAAARIHELDRGHPLLAEGAPAGACFVVVRGAVEVSTLRGAVRQRHGLRGPGALFGFEAFSDRRPQLFDCTTRERTIAVELPRDAFEPHLADRSPLAMKILTEICASLSNEFNPVITSLLKGAPPQASMSVEEIAGLSERPST